VTFPKGSGLMLNVGFNTIMRSLSEIARLEPEEIQKIYEMQAHVER